MKRFMIGTAFLLTWAVVLAAQSRPTPPLETVGQGSSTETLFDLTSMASSPFPSDWFTVSDHTNKTHLRINLPQPPECQTQVAQVQTRSICEDLEVLNGLDGFNLLPRLSIPFSGPIDAYTVNSDSVFLVSLGTAGFGEDYMPWGTLIGIDQVVWDPETNTLHIESDQLLAQHTRFALIVTRKVLDKRGAQITASKEFQQFRATMREDYKLALLEAIRAARQAGVWEQDIAVASVFTTQSATAILEKIRDQIHDPKVPPQPADFLLGNENYRTVFSLDQVTGTITWNQQTGADPSAFTSKFVDLTPIQNEYVGTIAFGKYSSPDYLVHPDQYFPAVSTRSGSPQVKKWEDIYFNLYLPSGTKPLNGWPVAIYVHGANQNKEERTLYVVTSMARHGIATIAINDVGHGFGPESTLSVSLKDGTDAVEFFAGGRGFDQNGNHIITTNEGISAAGPRRIVLYSDTYRQTAIDLMQLVREIEVGMDVDGDKRPDIDPSRIYLFGTSLGGGIATVFFGVEPNVRVGVINVPFDPVPGAVLSCVNRFAAGAYLLASLPSRLNPTGAPRISALDGCGVGTPRFDENFPLRNELSLTVELNPGGTTFIRSPVNNDVAGAMEIQQAIENLKWVGQAGSPLAYAPHLRKAPLAGLPSKSVLFQMAKADQTAPNPTDTAIVRAGELADVTLYYRHDLYYADNHDSQPGLDKNPHSFALTFGDISEVVQNMIGDFFQSDGGPVTVPEPLRYFEFPIVELPEILNYSSIQ